FRLSLHPTLWGENCVIRILDKEQGIRTLEDLGFTPQISQVLETFLSNPHGLFIVTGPTGSGKTTTLYAMLQRLARPGVNIMTLED
ncbi:ATPase, T2SS/T4P/T4SS family, partial [Acinetobacter baumannii]